VLILAFCCPASAGIIHSPAPQPDPSVVEVLPGTTDTEADTPAVPDSLTEVTLDLLAVLPALF
jgi:hypothetical protein